MYIPQLKKCVPILWKCGITPLVVGPQGVGKSEAMRQIAHEMGYNLIDLRVGQMADAGELIGLANFLKGKDGEVKSTKFIVPDFLPQNPDDKVIIHLDEINRGQKDILQAAFQLVYDREIFLNGFKLGENMHIIASMNPPTDEFDVLDFSDAAFNDRFCQLKIEPSVDAWSKYMKKKYPNHPYISFIETNPEAFGYNEMKDFDLKVSPSGRSGEMLIKVENYMDEIGFSDRDIRFDIMAGFIGDTNAASYRKFKSEMERPVQAIEIVEGFDKKTRERIVQYSDLDNGRPEIIDNITTQLQQFLLEQETVSMKQWNNVLDYFLLVPREHITIRLRAIIDDLSENSTFFSNNINKFFKEPKKVNELMEKLKSKA